MHPTHCHLRLSHAREQGVAHADARALGTVELAATGRNKVPTEEVTAVFGATASADGSCSTHCRFKTDETPKGALNLLCTRWG